MEEKAQVVFIPRMPSLNKYISAMNANRFVGNKLKADAMDEMIPIFRKKLRPTLNPVCIRFTYYEPNMKTDPDNIISAKKFILDALKLAGIIPNDGWAWIKGLSDRWLLDKEHPGVMIYIKEIR